jgi:hypothetical protein
MGLYVFITASFNHSTTATSISITARDKMCLLNGQVQGQIPESIILHDRDSYVYSDDTKWEVEFEKINSIITDENGK